MSSSQLGDTGITSIFLIARSNCAFVNCDSEEHLHAAIARFNGVPLRTHDSRCPRLVCRVRKPDDDLRAGVGGQRGIGMHMRWVQEQVRRTQETEDPTSSVSCSPIDAVGQFLRPTTSLSLSSDEDLGRSQVRFKSYGMKTQSSTGSYASTNSSVLSRYFPKRFFILKSLSQSDLDTSVEEGLWATQTHNEGILDQAYRTSQEVYLIFGVNKSGEFYGYARMVSRILQGEHRVSWAGQADCSPSPPVSSAQGRRQSVTVSEEHPLGGQKISAKGKERMSTYFSPTEHRMVEGSPLPLLPSQTTPGLGIDKGAVSLVPAVRPPTVTASGRTPRSAPAELGATRREVAPKEPITKFSLNEKARSPADEFALDRSAPIRALRDKKGTDESISGTTSSLQPVKEENNGGDGEEENEVKEKRLGNSEPDQGIVQPKEGEVHEAIWGEPFRVEWLCTERLPFYRTRHMRNPWNHDREVKVSRDGTELEPGIGQQLIDEWLALAHTASQGERSRNAGGSSRRATKSTPAIQPAVTSGGR
ncbi:hypothetical protein SERLA73DRAFT_189179 [Serpula lacrymans var. lacrymans S7.3]|uniref:YTH domain-containing protein n=2 Tax=Serpula lacrymans var. lacrymans TaxID=341189 RepID=F8QD12_SERL3|nr:uncharacterized protein SERLADRAFT_479887 [Serpula lacrymans var. lacrymans S7.9]EGN94027.1 hypothetical protein SERLA73DRAFT_189179 [Serpula lacrymans var. lacrymans S7.3]EGO19381.1 hypothetical protein SERLADRAFT_479887 [Serpula lacrymans var. lacrymans S7.9]